MLTAGHIATPGPLRIVAEKEVATAELMTHLPADLALLEIASPGVSFCQGKDFDFPTPEEGRLPEKLLLMRRQSTGALLQQSAEVASLGLTEIHILLQSPIHPVLHGWSGALAWSSEQPVGILLGTASGGASPAKEKPQPLLRFDFAWKIAEAVLPRARNAGPDLKEEVDMLTASIQEEGKEVCARAKCDPAQADCRAILIQCEVIERLATNLDNRFRTTVMLATTLLSNLEANSWRPADQVWQSGPAAAADSLQPSMNQLFVTLRQLDALAAGFKDQKFFAAERQVSAEVERLFLPNYREAFSPLCYRTDLLQGYCLPENRQALDFRLELARRLVREFLRRLGVTA